MKTIKATVSFISFLQGMLMGLAELIPGVSGSNFALVMGIYDDYVNFLDEVTNFFGNVVGFVLRQTTWKNLKKIAALPKWHFGLSIVVGMFIASALFSNIITELLDEYPNYLYALFFGLVAASIFVPLKEWKKKDLRTFLIFFVSFIGFFLFFGIKPASFGEDPPIPLLFIAGVVGVVGNVMPGISGPFLLLMIGLYDFIIALLASVTTLSVNGDQITKFGFFFVGQLLGLAFFVKILKFVLDKFPNELMAFLVGLMLASLRIIYPFFEGTAEDRTLVFPWEFDTAKLAVMTLLILIGLVVVFLIGKTNVDRNQIEKID